VDTAPKASGCILGGTQRNHREEPGKQKTRRCRAQELSRSRAQENERQKKDVLLDSVRTRYNGRHTDVSPEL
jgi:hypothetical protein